MTRYPAFVGTIPAFLGQNTGTSRLPRRGTVADGPSNELRERFARLGLSKRAWSRAARRHLRHIAGDLPLFDSAWIDACVCDRLLTPWQAETLNSSDPEAVFVGPVVLRSVVEMTPFGPVYRGHHAETGRELDLVQVPVPSASRRQVWMGLDQLCSLGGEIPYVDLPKRLVDTFESNDTLTVIYPASQGMRLRDWLTRRGRMTADVVAVIAGQLLEIVSVLERLGRCHGDIRPETVRLTQDGRVRLTQFGLRAALQPSVQYRDGMPPELCTGIAPERIGTNEPATPASERYAIGCLLWELLAGRPLTPHGSALGCLRTHLSHELPELEDFAPATPSALMDLIHGLLSADPTVRPREFIGKAIKVRNMPSLRQSVSSARPRRSGVGRKALALAASLVAAIGIWFAAPQIQVELAALNGESLTSPTGPELVEAAVVGASEPVPLMPLQPDATGRLELPGGALRSQDVAWFGSLHIIGAEDGTTEILVDKAWALHADAVRLERVSIRYQGAADEEPIETVVDVYSQQLAFVDSRLDATGAGSAVRWSAVTENDASAKSVSFDRVRVDGSRFGIAIGSDPRELSFRDSLFVHSGALLSLKRWPRSPATVLVDHSTIRGVDHLVGVSGDAISKGQPVRMRIASSVVEPYGAGMVAVSAEAAEGVYERLNIDAPSSIVHGQSPWPLFTAGPETPIIVGMLEFSGTADGADAASRLLSADVPLPPDDWPGFRVSPTVRSGEPHRDVTSETASGRNSDDVTQ